MTTWDDLLAQLASAPRENGTAAIDATAAWLGRTLAAAGVPVAMPRYAAEPWALRLVGAVALGGALAYVACLGLRRRRAALALVLALAAVVVVELDHVASPLGWIGRVAQPHVVATIAPRGTAEGTLILAAHFDTKTDLLDHVARAPVELLAGPALLLMLAGTAVPQLVRAAGVTAVLVGGGLFAAFTAGAWVPARSPGALDDGAACAVLVRVAETLAGTPPMRTRVELAFFSGEEIGVQGSWEYARGRFARRPVLPTAVVNLDPIGATPALAVLGTEAFVLARHRPDPSLVAVLDRVHRAERGQALPRTWYGGATDARSFLAHGVPAATLVSVPAGTLFPRGLHSARDAGTRIDRTALDATAAFLLAVVRAVDLSGFSDRAP